MCAEDSLPPLAASTLNEDTRFSKLLRSYPFLKHNLLKKYATDMEIEKSDSAILQYVQPANMTFHQYADTHTTKDCKDTDITEECNLKDVFMEGETASLRYSLRNSVASSSQEDLPRFTGQCVRGEIAAFHLGRVGEKSNKQLREHQFGKAVYAQSVE